MLSPMTQAGNVLQQLMDKHGIKNPTQLSKAMGNSKYQVTTKRILDGTTKEPKKKTLNPFADFFKVSVDVFFTSDNTSLATIESNIMPTQMHNKGVDYLNSSPIAQQLSESIIHLSASGKLDDSTCDAIGVLLGLGGGKGQGMMNKSIGKK